MLLASEGETAGVVMSKDDDHRLGNVVWDPERERFRQSCSVDSYTYVYTFSMHQLTMKTLGLKNKFE